MDMQSMQCFYLVCAARTKALIFASRRKRIEEQILHGPSVRI